MPARTNTILAAGLAEDRGPVFTALKSIFVAGGTDPQLYGELSRVLNIDLSRIPKIRKGTDSLSDAEADNLTTEIATRLEAFELKPLADELRQRAVIVLLKAPTAARRAEILHAAKKPVTEQLPEQRTASRCIPLVPYLVLPVGADNAEAIPIHPGMEGIEQIGPNGAVQLAVRTIEKK